MSDDAQSSPPPAPAAFHFQCGGRTWYSAELVTIRPRNQRYACAIRILATPDFAHVFISSDELATGFREVDDVERQALADRFALEQLRHS